VLPSTAAGPGHVAVGQLVRDLVAEHAPRLEGVRTLGIVDGDEDEDGTSPDADGLPTPAL